MKERIAHLILRHLSPKLIRILGRSIRFRGENYRFILERAERGESCIYCFWHNRFLMMPYLYRYVRGRKNICAMASRSRDGQYISDVLEGFGFEVVRGSSSRGGEAAVREMANAVKSGLDVAVATDGPKGPRYRVQPGVVLLAQLSGKPILPSTYDVTRKVRLKSWDRFIIPIPFTRGVHVIGEPMYVERGADAGRRGEIRERLEKEMRVLNERAASLLGVPCD